MIALKHIQTSFTATRHTILQSGRLSNTKNSILRFSKSNDSDSESETPPPEGDTRKQELLVRIAMLQAQKVRLADYLDERSEYLTKFGEDATAEFDKIGEDALKGLDEAGARIMENMDSRMQAFEESTGVNISEIEENENELAAFEDQIEKGRNEGLFFKNLTQGKPKEKVYATEEIKKIKELTKKSAGSETRRNIYLVLIGLLLIEIVDSFITSTPDWRKVAVLGLILVGLVSQFMLLSNSDLKCCPGFVKELSNHLASLSKEKHALHEEYTDVHIHYQYMSWHLMTIPTRYCHGSLQARCGILKHPNSITLL